MVLTRKPGSQDVIVAHEWPNMVHLATHVSSLGFGRVQIDNVIFNGCHGCGGRHGFRFVQLPIEHLCLMGSSSCCLLVNFTSVARCETRVETSGGEIGFAVSPCRFLNGSVHVSTCITGPKPGLKRRPHLRCPNARAPLSAYAPPHFCRTTPPRVSSLDRSGNRRAGVSPDCRCCRA
jgi:hypothetical protein